MRRFKQELPYDECLHILQKNHSGTLALCDKESYPYALPLSYVYDENCIYFHSAKEGIRSISYKRIQKYLSASLIKM